MWTGKRYFLITKSICQFYDHSVSKVRNETFWLDKTEIQCDSYLVPRLSPWLKVFSLVLSLVKRCGINYVRISAHTKIDFWHACTLFILIKKHHYSFFPLHLRCILIQSKSIKFFLAKLVKLILETPVLAITGTADDKTQDVMIKVSVTLNFFFILDEKSSMDANSKKTITLTSFHGF